MGIRIALAVAAVVVAVAGCSGGDPAPTDLPTAGSSPPQTSSSPSVPPTTAATTPTPTAPALPALARQDSPTGAQSFARYWMAILDYATTTGDTALLRRLADCAGCNAIADGIDTLRREGGKTTGGKITVLKSSIANYVPGRAALVDLTYSRAARTVENSSGEKQSVAAERNTRLLITLRRTSSWLITNAQPAK